MPSFLEAVQDAQRSGKVILMDGAMGTELQKAGLKEGECAEAWNLTQPDRVRAIHRAYVLAGANCLITNTFQSNPKALEPHGLVDHLAAINQAAIDIAKSVCGVGHFVLASIGPMALRIDEPIPITDSLRMADGYLLETWERPFTPTQIERFKNTDVNPHGVPVLVSYAFRSSVIPGLPPVLRGGLDPLQTGRLIKRAALAVGANCGVRVGLDHLIGIVRHLRTVTDLPILARPNAGTPTRVGDRWVYPETPEKMAAHLPKLIEAGATLVGGCCGTTPEHLAAFREVIEKMGVAWKP